MKKSMKIKVFDNSEDHFHEKDNKYYSKTKYYWTAKQEEIISVCMRNYVKNTVILHNLKICNMINQNAPAIVQETSDRAPGIVRQLSN